MRGKMLTAEQYNLLRQKVEAEVERRNACGSLAAYASGGNAAAGTETGESQTMAEETAGTETNARAEPSIDQSDQAEGTADGQAETGATILARQGKRVIEPLLAIQDYADLVLPEAGDPIPAGFGEELITYVNELSEEPMEGTSTSCRGACTGLCMSGCSNACSGCTGSCTGCGGCSASCGTGCASGARS
ncbi:MAG: hypothetical protein HFI40_00680 [Lachnospiraceae bacterium]|nr:hypothetical protein [Lachnospiraceae bacterium]